MNNLLLFDLESSHFNIIPLQLMKLSDPISLDYNYLILNGNQLAVSMKTPNLKIRCPILTFFLLSQYPTIILWREQFTYQKWITTHIAL